MTRAHPSIVVAILLGVMWAVFGGVAHAQTGRAMAITTDAGTTGPIMGVEWAASGDFVDAAGDLLEMAEVGLTAVRMPPVFDRGFYTLADSLGLTLFVELPFAQKTTRQLANVAAEADSILTMVLDAGRGHVSAGPIGITRLSDTASPRACEHIARLADRIRAAGREAYYTTRFGPEDACRETVDFVLVDVLGRSAPMTTLTDQVNQARAPGPRFGVSGVGVPVTQPQEIGWIIPGTIQAQARFVEDALNLVHDSELSHVFLHRWRDGTSDMFDVPDPWGRRYGLYTRSSDPRPALQVVRGFLLGIQDTFAFDRGLPPQRHQFWFPLIGWLMLAMTAMMYAGSPRFRSMIPRYFFAHGFFRNAVREAREVLPLTSTAILTVTGLSVGLIGSYVITGLQDSALALHWYRLLGAASRESLSAILGAPFVLTVLLGSVTLLSTSLWMGFWMIVTGRRARLLPSQALMLASWPRWQVLILLPLAMTLEAAGPVPRWAILLLGLGWIISAFWATIRTAYDLFKITNVPIPVTVLVWFMHPLVLSFAAIAGWSLFNWDHVRMAWHLLLLN